MLSGAVHTQTFAYTHTILVYIRSFLGVLEIFHLISSSSSIFDSILYWRAPPRCRSKRQSQKKFPFTHGLALSPDMYQSFHFSVSLPSYSSILSTLFNRCGPIALDYFHTYCTFFHHKYKVKLFCKDNIYFNFQAFVAAQDIYQDIYCTS